MTALSRLLLAPLRPLRGAVRVSRVSPGVDAAIGRAVESRRAWERDLAGWIARERADLQRGYVSAWRAARVAEGLCGSCGVRQRVEGRSVCSRCHGRIEAARLRREGARVAMGLCVRCGERPLASATRCAECLAREASEQRARHRARVSDDQGGCDVG